MDQFYLAISLFRRKKFDECINICNDLLQKNQQQKGPWELKMRAMIQRVYVDDIEADDGVPGESKCFLTWIRTLDELTILFFCFAEIQKMMI